MIPTGSTEFDVKTQVEEWLEKRFNALVECIKHKDQGSFQAVFKTIAQRIAEALEAEYAAGFAAGKIAKVDDEPTFTGVPGIRSLD